MRLCESARFAESDSALQSIMNRSYHRAMSSMTSEESEGILGRAIKRSELGPTEHLRTWSINFLDLPTEELVKLVYDILQDVCPPEYEIKDEVMICFLTAVASHYRENPYHSFLHACYVLHSVWMILTTTEVAFYLAAHEKLALCIAAICHDVDHDGLTNHFHVNVGSEVARRYNDASVLENHHCALTFAILERKNCALLESLPRNIQTEVRRMIIQCIMGTDMSNHFRLTSELCQLELPSPPLDEEDELLTEISGEERVFLCKAILHAADISNPVRSFDVDYFMSERVQEEFKNQTDKEKELGLPVMAHMDITSESMKYQAEVNFITFIVTPLWKRLAELFPSLELCLHQMRANKEKFEKLADYARSEEETSDEVDMAIE